MKKLISFRTETENKKLLIKKARELGISLSEYLDQISTESSLNLENEEVIDENPAHSISMLERGFFLRCRHWEIFKLTLQIEKKNIKMSARKKLISELLFLIKETHRVHKQMLAEEPLD